jgi:Alkylmercury lyase
MKANRFHRDNDEGHALNGRFSGLQRRRRQTRIDAMDPQALKVRNLTYTMFVDLGRAPTADEVAAAAGLSRPEVETDWRTLHHAHALVLNPATTEIRMANPFSAVPTAYRVRAAGRWWYGNCAWDALGICAALHVDGEVEASCPDCGEAIALELRGQRVDDERLVFHCLVPAANWWKDIVFT